MQFVDEVTIRVRGGDGGNGCMAFRREKFLPLGGPSGGDGGRGGDVVFRADTRLSTLLDLRYRRRIEAQGGEHGRGRDQYGRGGKTEIVRVPVGTQVFDKKTGALLADLDRPEAEHIVARGGKGGRGNIHFATPQDRAPRRAEPGTPGEEHELRLELKLLADVGVVGFPNVGKSTLIASVSRARPKIAAYPFTTLTPNLAVTSLGPERSFVIADIPGIIEGAAEGAGLGLRFLKHAERTRVLLHVVSVDPDPERDPVRDVAALEKELRHFDERLSGRPTVYALSKIDLPDARDALPELRAALEERGHPVHPFSAATGEGVRELMIALERVLEQHPVNPRPRAEPLPSAADRPEGHAPLPEPPAEDD